MPSLLVAVGIFATTIYILGLQLAIDATSFAIMSVTLAAQVVRVAWPRGLEVQGLELGGRDATPLVTVVLAAVTAWLAFETQRLARGASREIGTLERQATTAERQLEEFKKQGRHRPQLEWQQRGLNFHWEQGAETIGPKTGKAVRVDFELQAINLGGAAFMTEATVKGDGRITFESPRKLIPTKGEYLSFVSFDAVGGTPFRFAGVVEQRYRSWDLDEEFVAHVLIALASDWFDHNDPRPTVIPLQRTEHVEEDAAHWTADHFDKYDADIARQRAQPS